MVNPVSQSTTNRLVGCSGSKGVSNTKKGSVCEKGWAREIYTKSKGSDYMGSTYSLGRTVGFDSTKG